MAERLTSSDPLIPLLACRPLGLFSDIDGTLAPIVARPEQARISPACRQSIEALVAGGVRVGLITGRTLDMARSITGLNSVSYATNHGLEFCVDGRLQTPVELQRFADGTARVLAETRSLAFKGLVTENKGPALAFHFRQAADEAIARSAILRAIQHSPSAADFIVTEGRKVIELRPPVDADKGSAFAVLAARMRVGSAICLGDDTTDIDMFRAAARWRTSGTLVASVAVRSEEETPDLLAAADYWVDGVEGVEWLLGSLLTAILSRSS